MIDAGEFLEWAEVFGNFYGTGGPWVEEKLNSNLNVLVDIDVDGARQIKRAKEEAVLIFILPPTFTELEKRLSERKTEENDEIKLRLTRVREEIDASEVYDYLVINSDLDETLLDLISIIRTEGLRMPSGDGFWNDFFSVK